MYVPALFPTATAKVFATRKQWMIHMVFANAKHKTDFTKIALAAVVVRLRCRKGLEKGTPNHHAGQPSKARAELIQINLPNSFLLVVTFTGRGMASLAALRRQRAPV
eukprot:GHVT01016006.1.p1 GENE.GHVT01016006.1~~GHVT01016006.1.p1  ORF type:complete len:107 (+),score=11.10 GHVT01016006.1:1525-1845(+)